MPLPGASTRTFKAYGKRKTHTINRTSQSLWDDEEAISNKESVPQTKMPSITLSSSGESNDDDSDTDTDYDQPPKPVGMPLLKSKSNVRYQSQGKRDLATSVALRRAGTAPPATDKENVVPTVITASKNTTARKPSSQALHIVSGPRKPIRPLQVRPTTPLGSPRKKNLSVRPDPSVPAKSSKLAQSSLQFDGVHVPVRRAPKASSSKITPTPRASTRDLSPRSPRALFSSELDGSVEIYNSFNSLSINKSRTLILEDEDCEEDLTRTDTSSRSPASISRRPEINKTTSTYPSFLKELMSITATPVPYDFTSFVSSPPSPFSISAGTKWTKIGEASYSEVFASEGEEGEQMVIKIIPVSNVEAAAGVLDPNIGNHLPFVSDWTAVQREIWASALFGEGIHGIEGFVEYKGAFIVQGPYPSRLLSEWDLYRRRLQRERRADCDAQIRPSVLHDTQVYAIICLAHAGTDLESFKLKSWKDAASVLWQAAQACARGEEKVEFEHRDLHWGNLLVKPIQKSTPPLLALDSAALSLTGLTPDSVAAPLDSQHTGLQVTLIDFTLSRAKSSDGFVIFDAFDDEEVFDGQGDPQFDVYRTMRDLIKDDWEGFHPITNLYWLHYLSLKLLHAKKLRRPVSGKSMSIARAAEEIKWYETLVGMEARLRSQVLEQAPKGKKGKSVPRWTSAQDLVRVWKGDVYP
ncbi:haspin protein kinase [Microbotryum lychnidis-dioicae p1A1 Lamole]|uniref:non-specific serine/threonine protein kinase n=1 Tax=Microbotryum lychnidis-dioicae (strain p1A1 Lamole / MvSl-1064) TaxID=683840 RepID=U5HBC6_USTV1|nr:haspin protein kinase [Microbotryum lychnidis-dioicae p1A1 Lamole]|eukprot:KDE05137.1 haspin protein kinase [Microbotryum lychnidis-dioicae p1A1 Lamole]